MTAQEINDYFTPSSIKRVKKKVVKATFGKLLREFSLNIYLRTLDEQTKAKL